MTVSSNLIGACLGGYDVQALIGSGGIASVYRAFDPTLQRSVAIKVLWPATASQPDFVDRFRQEARLIASLRHPNGVGTSAPTQSASAPPTTVPVATALPAGLPVAATNAATIPTLGGVNPINQLRALLISGVTDGRISTGGDALIAKLGSGEGALAQNDPKTAIAQLQALQLLLTSGGRSGTIAPEMLRQALTGIDAIAHSAGLTLPFSVTSG